MSQSQTIDQLLGRATRAGDVPGVVAMVSTDRQVIYEGASGQREIGKDAPMTIDTVMWIASMTKALTAVAAMQLIERGRLALEQPAAEILPQLAHPQVLEGFDATGQPRLRPATRAITVRHLLTHTSGYTYDTWNAATRRYMEQASIPGVRSGRNLALTIPLAFDPGERWEYGIGIDWTGKLVEALSGQRLGHFLQENLFAPLGMCDTGFARSPSMRERLATIHQRDADGSLRATTMQMPEQPEFEMGGGGLYGTARDYLAFARMMLNEGTGNGVQVLRPETVALMSRNHIGELNVGELKTAMPTSSLDATFWPDLPCKWGLSFLINTQRSPEGRSAGSLAWAGLANSYYWIDPQRKVAGVCMTQILPFFDPKSLRLFKDFESAVYDGLTSSAWQ